MSREWRWEGQIIRSSSRFKWAQFRFTRVITRWDVGEWPAAHPHYLLEWRKRLRLPFRWHVCVFVGNGSQESEKEMKAFEKWKKLFCPLKFKGKQRTGMSSLILSIHLGLRLKSKTWRLKEKNVSIRDKEILTQTPKTLDSIIFWNATQRLIDNLIQSFVCYAVEVPL